MFKKLGLALAFSALFVSGGYAMKYMELKDALAQSFPKDSKFFKNDVEMTEEKAKLINEECKTFFKKGDKVTVYIAKDAKSNVIGYCMTMAKLLSPYSSVHKLAFIFGSDLALKQISVLELSDSKAYAYKINNKAFLEQFNKVKDWHKASLGKGIDAESGATESSQLLLDNLKTSALILEQFYGK